MMKGIIMIDFTCDCGNSYNELTGDLDERICNDCLNDRLDSVRLVKVGDQWYNEDNMIEKFHSLKLARLKYGNRIKVLNEGEMKYIAIDDGFVFGNEKEFEIKTSK